MASKQLQRNFLQDILEDSDIEIDSSDLDVSSESENDSSYDDEVEISMRNVFEIEEENEVHAGTCVDSWRLGCRDNVNRFPFRGETKINVEIPDSSDVLSIVKLFLTADILNVIVSETNAYAKKFLEMNKENISSSSRTRYWSDTNTDEMLCFFGLVILTRSSFKTSI